MIRSAPLRLASLGAALLLAASCSDTASSGATAAHRLFDAVPPLHASVDGYAAGEVELISQDGERWELPVRMAVTPAERQHGLMEVAELPDGTGMAFLFEDDRVGGFWMSGTLVPLDIAYVDAEGKVVTILTMLPCTQDPCPTYPPTGPYRNTLEVPGGFFERIGFGPDWRVTFDVP